MFILSRDGAGARNVFNTACDALTIPGYFVEGEDPVLQKGFLRQLLKDKLLVESIRRVVENWKTALKVKGPLLLNSLLKIYPNLKN